MPLMWVVTSGLIWLVLGSGIVLASAIGAVLTPTDPVLADSILTGRLAQQSIPQRMRDSLSAESGANDGLALLLVALPGLVLIAPHDTALLHWVLRGLLQEILGGLLLGLVVGWLFARLTRWAYTKPFTDENSILTSAIALALFVLALGRVLGLAAVFAVFISGLAFNRVQAVHEEAMHERTQAAIARFFDIPIFIYFGAMLPWREWLTLGWGGPWSSFWYFFCAGFRCGSSCALSPVLCAPTGTRSSMAGSAPSAWAPSITRPRSTRPSRTSSGW
jgi:NhaP-type Na+/H+ or K+/H+ antiporter